MSEWFPMSEWQPRGGGFPMSEWRPQSEGFPHEFEWFPMSEWLPADDGLPSALVTSGDTRAPNLNLHLWARQLFTGTKSAQQ